MIFTGVSEHTIDEKNRVAIPAKYRSRLNPDRDGLGFVIALKQGDTALSLYTERGFEKIAERHEPTFRPAREQSKWELFFFSTAEQVEPDSQGRIVIPPRMLARVGLGREVVICGVRDHLEIRSKQAYDERLNAYLSEEPSSDGAESDPRGLN
jgi:MraZ protein